MTSRRLDIALREAIQDHADDHHHGAQDMERILAALGEVASFYLAEVPQESERHRLFNTFCAGVAVAMVAKTLDQIPAGAPIS